MVDNATTQRATSPAILRNSATRGALRMIGCQAGRLPLRTGWEVGGGQRRTLHDAPKPCAL
eukprot:8988896-Pyramimonas_sp.AAC.1